jgi:hypothetical protein
MQGDFKLCPPVPLFTTILEKVISIKYLFPFLLCGFHPLDCGLAGRYPTPYSVEDLALKPHLLLHAGFNRRFQDGPLPDIALGPPVAVKMD